MKIIKRAYNFRFYPQNDLKIILAKTFGCCRFVFNRILDLSEKNYASKFSDKDKQIAKAQRILSRRVKGSNNRNKQRIIVARLHEKKSNIINDLYHKLSSKLINENQEIIIEDLAVKNMLKNRKLSRSIHSIAWSRFTNMLEYKSNWQERELSKANRFYPSSKLCSCCGHVNHGLKLSDRAWTCSNCNAQHDRDENACINLFNYDESSYKNSSKTVGTTGCGGNVRPKILKKITSKKSKAVSCEAGILAFYGEVVQNYIDKSS